MELLNVQRAAQRLGVAPHTVRRWTASGLLPCTRTPGGHRRMRQEDVEALAEQIGGSNQREARRARERELDTLLETSLAFVSRLELTDLLREIAERLTRLMDCNFCAINTYDEASQTVTMLADFDESGRRLPDVYDYPLSRFPLTRRVLEEQVTAVVNLSDPAADPDELAELKREHDKSLLMVPLVCGGRSIGLLELMDHLRERRFSRQDLRICRAVAAQAAVALHNAESFAGAGVATQDLDSLCGLLDEAGDELGALSVAEDIGGLLDATAKAACRIFGATSSVVMAEGQSSGFAVPEVNEQAEASADGHRTPRRRALPGAEVLTASDGDGGHELSVTLSLPRPARGGESQLLGLVAAVAGLCLRRLAQEATWAPRDPTAASI
ncbi:MAG: GAF domain-containing protein [Acidimicrobiales bacterium]|jgi:excisionase family DNA binding protein